MNGDNRLIVPRWYRWQLVIWLFSGLPFQWFFTDFNGLPFFSLPDRPGPSGPSTIPWLLAILFLYHPLLSAPIALWESARRNRPNLP